MILYNFLDNLNPGWVILSVNGLIGISFFWVFGKPVKFGAFGF